MAQAQQIRKEVVRADRVYWSPTGPIPVPRKMAESWVNEFRRMSQGGYSVPVVVEHQDFAKPSPKNNPDVWDNPDTVGRLTDLALDDEGRIFFAWQPKPGVIGERALPNLASPEFATAGYRSEDGGEFGPCVLHFALTEYPVNAGQPDRWEIVSDGVARMSLAGSMRMAADPDEDEDEFTEYDDKYDEMLPDEGGDETIDEDFAEDEFNEEADDYVEELPDVEDMPLDEFDEGNAQSPEQPGAPSTNPGAPGDANFGSVLGGLAECFDLQLPADTTPDNFFERCATALYAIRGMKAGDQVEQYSDEDAAEEDDGEFREEENYSGGPIVQAMGIKQLKAENARLKKELAAQRARKTQERVSGVKQRMGALIQSGRATPDEAKTRLAPLTQQRMSIKQSNLALDKIEPWLEARESMGANTAAAGPSEAIESEFEDMGIPWEDTGATESKKNEIAKGATVFGGR